MSILTNKIDFVVLFTVENANPNGDPLNDNMPRTDYEGYGEVSDVCIKRKIRNRLQDNGEEIFVQANERIMDGNNSLEARFNSVFGKNPTQSNEEIYNQFCEKWTDVRSFGQVITFSAKSIGIRGPVSISLGRSVSPVETISMQITRSTNGKLEENGKRSRDTMGTKHFISHGLYRVEGSINPYFAEKTKFTEDDSLKIKEALRTLFVNDSSSARPDGSMEVQKVFWFVHPNILGISSSAKVHRLVEVSLIEDISKPNSLCDYDIRMNQEKLESYTNLGLKFEELDGN